MPFSDEQIYQKDLIYSPELGIMTESSKLKLVLFYKNIAIFSLLLRNWCGWDNTWTLFHCFLALETEKDIIRTNTAD